MEGAFERDGNVVRLERGVYERVWLNDEHTSCTHKRVGTQRYEIELLDGEHVRFTRNGVSKVAYVKRDDEWAYKCQKTQIRAMGGAEMLFEHTLASKPWGNMAMNIADHAIDNMREARR